MYRVLHRRRERKIAWRFCGANRSPRSRRRSPGTIFLPRFVAPVDRRAWRAAFEPTTAWWRQTLPQAVLAGSTLPAISFAPAEHLRWRACPLNATCLLGQTSDHAGCPGLDQTGAADHRGETTRTFVKWLQGCDEENRWCDRQHQPSRTIFGQRRPPSRQAAA